MVKAISVGLNAHIQQEVTTLAKCWKLVRTDGVGFFFTSHDSDLTVDVDLYISKAGFSPTAIANANDLSVDNMDVNGVFDDDSIKDVDLAAGKFDYAEVFIFFVNWQDTSQGPCKMRRGFLGEVVSSPIGWFKVEIRGMTQLLQQKIVEIYSPECRADLGDSRCKVPLQPPIRQDLTQYEVGDYVRISTDPSLGGQNQYENRVYKCVTAGITSVMPNPESVIDSSPGVINTEGGTYAFGYMIVVSNTSLDGRTLLLSGKTYTFETVLTDVDGHVLIGATVADTGQNLIDAINFTGTAGVQYAASTTQHTLVAASAGDGGLVNTTSDYVGITSLVVGQSDLTIGAGTVVSSNITVHGDVAAFHQVFLVGGIGAVDWEPTQAWTRHAVIASVTDRKTFTITYDEPRAIDDWFTYGTVTFVDGENIGKTTEVKSWVQGFATVTLFLNLPYLPIVGDKIAIAPGCNKSLNACRDKFDNLLNMRAESYLPGNDQAFRTPNVTR